MKASMWPFPAARNRRRSSATTAGHCGKRCSGVIRRITATELLEAPKTPLWQRMQKKIERVEQAAWWAVHRAAAEIQHHLERKELHHER